MHRVWRSINRYLWCNSGTYQCVHWKYFTFITDSRAETCAELKSIYNVHFVKLIMRMVSYIPLGKYFGRWPLVNKVKKMWNFWSYRRQSIYIFDKVTLASTVHERTNLLTIVSYKCNVVAKHGSSKALTANKLWLLELRIKSTRILASIPDALWDMCKLSIMCTKRWIIKDIYMTQGIFHAIQFSWHD